jgi:carbamoyl-phosphate synthase small subunit
MKARLALENGALFEADSFGAPGEIAGEVVFNTSLSGYQEIFTDPSYTGQIVTLTYPLGGNYGVNELDYEAPTPQVAGVILREYIDAFSNFRATKSLGAWLTEHGIIAIHGLDTRMLTRMIRDQGAMRGVISTADMDESSLMQKVKLSPSMNGRDLASQVTCAAPYTWDGGEEMPFTPVPLTTSGREGSRFHVVAYDYGIKRNILRRLSSYGCTVDVVPAAFPAEEVLSMHPDGVFLSNGPGDPAAVRAAIANVKTLMGKIPIFGICLGHQILALALGGKTYKLKFGHRGGNHPVKNLLTGSIEITSQNHGFAVDPESLDRTKVEITHTNLYDGTNEGFRHRQLPVFSVQYHPEASPGPHDSDYLFRDFVALMKTGAPVVQQPG